MTSLHVSQHPLTQHKLAALRSTDTDHRSFRGLVRELALLMCYEATQDLRLEAQEVMTPMGPAAGMRTRDRIGLVPVLRAGLGLVDGVLELLPDAQVWHIGLYRDEQTLQPVAYYNRLPTEPTVNLCLVLDPMLATGGSAVATVDILKGWGVRRIKYLGLIASPEGVARLGNAHPDVPVHVAAVDERLNNVGFILPGLGDAGDRQFGT